MNNKRDDQHSNSDSRKADSENESLDPFEINFLPQFVEGRGPRKPFVNEFGVTIGDHIYESPESPLSQWTEQTDPFIMAGDQWVHPFKDVGFQTAENRDYFEKGIVPSSEGARFMHPDKNAAYEAGLDNAEEEGQSPDPA
jgi:hypothetical protein